MKRLKPRTVPYRRKREQRTNYKKRLHLLLSRKPRIVVRLTNTRVIAQLVTFTPLGDHVQVGLDSTALRKEGWTFACDNYPAAYLTGIHFGKKVLAAGVQEAILDTGLQTPLRKGKIYAFLKGVLDAGVIVPVGNKEIFPSEDMLQGKHIAPLEKVATAPQFAQYLKTGQKVAEMPTLVEKMKAQLLG